MLISRLKQYVNVCLKPIVCEEHTISGEILQYARTGHYAGIDIISVSTRFHVARRNIFFKYKFIFGMRYHSYTSLTDTEALRR